MSDRGYQPEPGTPQGEPPDGGSGTATPPPARRLVLKVDYQGFGRVELGGVDLSPYTQQIQVEATAGGGTVITIRLANDVALDLEAEAVLDIKREPGVAGGEVMADGGAT